MAVDPLAKLVRLRKSRAETAERDLAALRVEKGKVEQSLQAERQRLNGLAGEYGQTELRLQGHNINSMAEFASVQGDLLAIRAMAQESQQQISQIEASLALFEKRIIAARKLWRDHENAHDRFVELSDEMKKRGLLAALATEEFMDS